MMMTRRIMFTLLLVLPSIAGAQEEPAPPAQPIVAVSGMLDAYVSFNPDRGSDNMQTNSLHAFDQFANGMSFSYAEIVLEKSAAPVGARIDLGFGPTADVVGGSDSEPMRHIQQAYLDWKPTDRVLIRIGKRVTHHGLEVIETPVNWNYTHGLLFTWAIPFTETGVSVTWAASPKVDLSLYVVNGLNDTIDGNEFKAPSVQATVRPTGAVTVIGTYTVLNELDGAQGEILDFGDSLQLAEVVAIAQLGPKWQVAVDAVAALDLSVAGGDRGLFALAAYARVAALANTFVALRGEVLRDGESGTLTLPGDMPATVVEGTGSLSVAPAKGLLLSLDARVDHCVDGPPLDPMMGAMTQFTMTVGAVAAF